MPKYSRGAWSPGTEPSSLNVLGEKMGHPEQCCQSCFTLKISTHLCVFELLQKLIYSDLAHKLY